MDGSQTYGEAKRIAEDRKRWKSMVVNLLLENDRWMNECRLKPMATQKKQAKIHQMAQSMFSMENRMYSWIDVYHKRAVTYYNFWHREFSVVSVSAGHRMSCSSNVLHACT